MARYKSWKTWQKGGAWLLIALGVIHHVSSIIMLSRPVTDEAVIQVIDTMKSISPGVPTTHSLWDFHLGFSFLLGWLIIFVGINALMNVRVMEQAPKLGLLNIGAGLVICLHSINYLFIAPVLFSGLASCLFIVAYIKLSRDQKRDLT